MPVEKVEGGYRWGKTGKVYKRRIDAVKQGQAAYASGYNQYAKGGTTFKLCPTCTTPTACTASQKCAKGTNDYRVGGMVLNTKDNRKKK